MCKLTFLNLTEGLWADQYTDPSVQSYIQEQYSKRYPSPTETPQTHPWKFNPLTPPTGWKYDPYYEIWLKEKHDY